MKEACDWTIRPLTDEDIPQSAAVIREGFRDVAEAFGLTQENCPGNGAFLQPEALRAGKERGLRMYGAFMGDKQAGFIAIKPRDASTWYLEKLAVIPAFRCRGAGRLLVRHAVAEIRRFGGNRIIIGIIAHNHVLKEWYATLGFVAVSTRGFPTLPFTVCYMEHDLAGGSPV